MSDTKQIVKVGTTFTAVVRDVPQSPTKGYVTKVVENPDFEGLVVIIRTSETLQVGDVVSTTVNGLARSGKCAFGSFEGRAA